MISGLLRYLGFGPVIGAEVTERQKQKDRKIVLRRIKRRYRAGRPIIVRDYREFRDVLRLGRRMSVSRFRSAVWHLRFGDGEDHTQLIYVDKPVGEGGGIRGTYERTLRVAVL